MIKFNENDRLLYIRLSWTYIDIITISLPVGLTMTKLQIRCPYRRVAPALSPGTTQHHHYANK